MKMRVMLTYADGFKREIVVEGSMRLSTLEKIQDTYKHMRIQFDVIEYIR